MIEQWWKQGQTFFEEGEEELAGTTVIEFKNGALVKEFAKVLVASLAGASSINGARKNLATMLLFTIPEGLRIVTSDGDRLAVTDCFMAIENPKLLQRPAIFHRSGIETLLSGMSKVKSKERSFIRIRSDGLWRELDFGVQDSDVWITVKEIEGVYLNWQQLMNLSIEDRDFEPAAIAGHYLEWVGRMACAVGSPARIKRLNRTMPMVIELYSFSNNKYHFDHKNRFRSMLAVMPMFVQW